jgi:hypothetical protein
MCNLRPKLTIRKIDYTNLFLVGRVVLDDSVAFQEFDVKRPHGVAKSHVSLSLSVLKWFSEHLPGLIKCIQ